LDRDSDTGTVLAIGNKGKTLYAAGAHVIDRWDLVNGRKLGSLGTNELIVKFLKVSLDGSTLVAGFGDFNSSATSFAVWESGRDQPAFRFSSPHGATVGISPDGQTLVLSHRSEKKLELLDWRSGKRSQFPLRGPYASGSAYSLNWSPDGKRLAAYVDTYPASIIVYETKTWKPLAQWCCGKIMSRSEFVVNQDGKLLQLMGREIHSLDLTALKSVAE
jgi:WD40 repeat protein